ncbi:MAG: hypothetical protein VSS52_005840 [Thiotrichaceae bacterium]|nr:hypothetical protein [Thiotrichaceae bacterium]
MKLKSFLLFFFCLAYSQSIFADNRIDFFQVKKSGLLYSTNMANQLVYVVYVRNDSSDATYPSAVIRRITDDEGKLRNIDCDEFKLTQNMFPEDLPEYKKTCRTAISFFVSLEYKEEWLRSELMSISEYQDDTNYVGNVIYVKKPKF